MINWALSMKGAYILFLTFSFLLSNWSSCRLPLAPDSNRRQTFVSFSTIWRHQSEESKMVQAMLYSIISTIDSILFGQTRRWMVRLSHLPSFVRECCELCCYKQYQIICINVAIWSKNSTNTGYSPLLWYDQDVSVFFCAVNENYYVHYLLSRLPNCHL